MTAIPNDPLAPDTIIRYLMLDLTSGTEFSWMSAKDMYVKAKTSANAPMAPLSPPLLRDALTVNPDAMRWALKRLTEKNPRILFFDSVADAASRDGVASILAAPVPAEWTLSARVKLQQAMLYALNYASTIIEQHDWRIADTILIRASIPGLDFKHAVEIVTGKTLADYTAAIESYIADVRDHDSDYLGFCNSALDVHDPTVKMPTFDIHNAYEALLFLARNDYQVATKDMITHRDIQSGLKKSGAGAEFILTPAMNRPLADIEKNSFKIDGRIFNASTDGVTNGMTVEGVH